MKIASSYLRDNCAGFPPSGKVSGLFATIRGAYVVVISGGREWVRSPVETSEMAVLYLQVPYAHARSILRKISLHYFLKPFSKDSLWS